MKKTAHLAHEPASPTKAIHDTLVTTHLQTPQLQYHAPAPGGYGAATQMPAPTKPILQEQKDVETSSEQPVVTPYSNHVAQAWCTGD